MTTTVKTAVSIDKALYEQAEALAQEMNISRSHLFGLALEQFLRRRQGQLLRQRIDAAVAGEPALAQQEHLAHMRQSHRRLVEGEW